jgi:prefoldin subunit 5
VGKKQVYDFADTLTAAQDFYDEAIKELESKIGQLENELQEAKDRIEHLENIDSGV